MQYAVNYSGTRFLSTENQNYSINVLTAPLIAVVDLGEITKANHLSSPLFFKQNNSFKTPPFPPPLGSERAFSPLPPVLPDALLDGAQI